MKKLFTLAAVAAMALTANAQQFYIMGDAPLGAGWGNDPIAMDLADDGFTNTITVELDAQKWFALTDTPTFTDWDDINGNHRFGVWPKSDEGEKGQPELTDGSEWDIIQCQEPTMTIGKGSWTITYNAQTKKLTVSGAAIAPTEAMTIVGPAEVFGEGWAPSDADNNMTDNGDGTYTLVLKGIELVAGTYEYKSVWAESWENEYPVGSGNNWSFTIDEDGVYDLTFNLTDNGDGTRDCTCDVVPSEATAITAIAAQKNAKNVYYNVAGQRTNANAKGVVIVNGKKVIKK